MGRKVEHVRSTKIRNVRLEDLTPPVITQYSGLTQRLSPHACVFSINVVFDRGKKQFDALSFYICFGKTISFNYFALPVFDLALIIPARDGKLFPLKLLLHGATANIHRRGQRFVLVR